MIIVTSGQRDEDEDTDTEVGGQRLETLETFEYLGSAINEGVTSQKEINTRLPTIQMAK